VEIVKLLLKSGAEVNTGGGEYGNVLQAAAYQGNESIVKLLWRMGRAECNGRRIWKCSLDHDGITPRQ
jgi:ankyrin repeat protein